MAIISDSFLGYFSSILKESVKTRKPAYIHDELFALIEKSRNSSIEFSSCSVTESQYERARALYLDAGVIGVIGGYFNNKIINSFTDIETERQVVALKLGYKSLPATTCSIIMQGFGKMLDSAAVLKIYSSHGLSNGMKELAKEFDFLDINRRVKALSKIILKKGCHDEFIVRYEAMHNYIQAKAGSREMVIRSSGIKRSNFFYYCDRFKHYGMLGLADTGEELFRSSKIGLKNESKIVIKKLQYPDKTNLSFIEILKVKDIKVSPSAISKIFNRWNIKEFNSKFLDNLKRLESDLPNSGYQKLLETENPVRFVDECYLATLSGMKDYGLPTDSPGLFLIWAYIEKLGIFPVLDKLGLTRPENDKGYSWFDLILLNIGRIFYGIPSYSATCEHQEPSIAFFAGLVKPPCNDTFLNGLENKITEKEVYDLRKWLVGKAYDLGLIEMKQTALDFHQIDLDVIFDKLRKFGKGPSPKKKICYNGFRPHIAWDVGTGCLIAAEFRKGSARGTTTAVPFIKDFMPPEMDQIFETIYIDSEYTGKNLWQFILDPDEMNANMTACLKQNPLVKKARDKFLKNKQNNPEFWKYYDDKHVYSSQVFSIIWQNKYTEQEYTFKLNCVVKKNIDNGKLRCFGTSKLDLSSREILVDYSKRWLIENGIKDLIASYYIDNCPGTRPHLTDIHFLIISICRIIYKMIEKDMGEDIKNSDGTIKTMSKMRSTLFRQGAGTIFFRNGTFDIKLQNSYSPNMTKTLNQLFKKLGIYQGVKLDVLDGAKLKISMQIPYGEEHRNFLKKCPLSTMENF